MPVTNYLNTWSTWDPLAAPQVVSAAPDATATGLAPHNDLSVKMRDRNHHQFDNDPKLFENFRHLHPSRIAIRHRG